MARTDPKVRTINSLRTQLCLGATALLGITLITVSYSLMILEGRVLREEIEKTLTLQGRNIALSSEKALLRSDPEFELFPLVNRILAGSNNITSVVVTDADGLIQGDDQLQNIGTTYEPDLSEVTPKRTPILAADEQLYENDDAYVLKTPVRSLDRVVGHVFLSYSKHELHKLIRRDIIVTLICGAIAFILGIGLSLLFFRRISRPIDILMRAVNDFGKGDLGNKIDVDARNEFHILAESFNDMTGRIAAAQKELIVKERIEKELEIAHDIQNTLIPKELHQPVGFEIGIHYESATQVGGDYVDIIPTESGHLALVMADVSGKGVPGLVVMAMLKIMVHELVQKATAPSDVVRRLNVTLAKNIRANMFVTFFVAYLDTRSGAVRYSNAGHNPLLVFKSANSRCTTHKMRGYPLGVFSDAEFVRGLEEYSVELDPGDVILQYTDGLSESVSPTGEQFGIERIAKIARANGSDGAKALVQELTKTESQFRGSRTQVDDITLLAVSATGERPSPRPVLMREDHGCA